LIFIKTLGHAHQIFRAPKSVKKLPKDAKNWHYEEVKEEVKEESNTAIMGLPKRRSLNKKGV